MKVLLSVSLTLLLAVASSVAWSQTTRSYDPVINRWDPSVRPGLETQVHGPSSQYGYASPNSKSLYKPYEDRWELTPPRFDPRYNPYNKRWESPGPGAQFQYNREQGTWRYMPPSTAPLYNPHSRRWEYPR